MKKLILSGMAFICTYLSIAQTPDDVLRYSYFPQHGSARSMATGGALGSLGGDITALFGNPAGLAFYKTQEFVISPGFMINNNRANYLTRDTFAKRNGFDLGISGGVFGFKSDNPKVKNEAFSIGINQIANFNNNVHYRGSNQLSSYSEDFANQFAASGQSIDAAINNPGFAFGTGMALYTYLVDTFRTGSTGPDSIVIKSLPEMLLAKGIPVVQERRLETRGGIYEIGIGYAANMDEKLFIGGTLGIPIVSYTRRSMYRETDASGIDTNGFNSFQLNDTLSSHGVGVNLKLGVIYRPKEYIRLGLAIHTPTFYSMTDNQKAGMITNSENYAGVQSVYSRLLLNGLDGKTDYMTTSPWRVIASGSYVFREISDTRRQRAFVTADIEYVNYRGTRFNAGGETVEEADKQYYRDVKAVIKNTYKGAFNFRVGGEVKFNTIMFRIGGAYYGSPYKEPQFQSSISQLTGGLGYRDQGMFIDLTYAHNWIKDVNFPYRLDNKQNYYAVQHNQRGNIVLTLGFKL